MFCMLASMGLGMEGLRDFFLSLRHMPNNLSVFQGSVMGVINSRSPYFRKVTYSSEAILPRDAFQCRVYSNLLACHFLMRDSICRVLRA